MKELWFHRKKIIINKYFTIQKNILTVEIGTSI